MSRKESIRGRTFCSGNELFESVQSGNRIIINQLCRNKPEFQKTD
jgi:hypothetical protein